MGSRSALSDDRVWSRQSGFAPLSDKVNLTAGHWEGYYVGQHN